MLFILWICAIVFIVVAISYLNLWPIMITLIAVTGALFLAMLLYMEVKEMLKSLFRMNIPKERK